MKWKKKGKIWSPDKTSDLKFKYGILPVPLYLEDLNVVRVFFGSSDKNINSRVFFIDLNPNNLNDILFESEMFSLDIGRIGTFDDSGVVPSCILKQGKDILLYTVGFQRCEKVPYMLYAGIAKSKNNGITFTRPHDVPILERTPQRPISQGAPSVIFHNGIYKMWHWYSTKWIKINGKLYLDYRIGYAESFDGLKWDMKNITCIAPDIKKNEFAVARPFVIFEHNTFKMWYSIRYEKKLYRIGYAESDDGKIWQRRDHLVGIDVSDEGWDSEMICYPSIIDLNGNRYLFYNGNSNGENGFGYAILEEQ
jgi:hypothetical protein